jgi:predicted dehydrogenase
MAMAMAMVTAMGRQPTKNKCPHVLSVQRNITKRLEILAMTQIDGKPSIALIGCGRWGRNIARVLSELGALAVVVDPDAERISDYVRSLGAVATTDIDAAFGPSISGVAIAAPAVDHYRLARHALNSGKAVFVEKPLALQLDDAANLARISEEKSLPLMIGHLLQYHPAFIRLKEVIESGEIGDVRHIVSNRLNPGAIRVEENALWSMGPHDFSMVLGITKAEPISVEAQAVRVVDPAVPDQFSVQLRFTDLLTAQVNVSWLSPFKEHKLVVLGTKGALVFEDTAGDRCRKLLIYRDFVDHSGSVPAFVKGPGDPIDWPTTEPLHAEMSTFLDCVQSGGSSRSGPEEAIPVLRLLHRASAAAGL